MKNLAINGRRGLFGLDTDAAADDARIWALLCERAAPLVTVHHGGLQVFELGGIGRAVRLVQGGHILVEPHSPAEFLKLVAVPPPGHPVSCPFCSSKDVRDVNSVRVKITRNERDPADKSSMELDEYQCRGDCGGRSFWV
jgi:hypothetical protein